MWQFQMCQKFRYVSLKWESETVHRFRQAASNRKGNIRKCAKNEEENSIRMNNTFPTVIYLPHLSASENGPYAVMTVVQNEWARFKCCRHLTKLLANYECHPVHLNRIWRRIGSKQLWLCPFRSDEANPLGIRDDVPKALAINANYFKAEKIHA